MICIAGKNDIGAQILTFAAEHFGVHDVVAIATRADTGRTTWQSSLVATAQRLGVRLISLDDAHELAELHLFSAEFDRIVVPSRFRADAQLYNIHFSLLPRYKGMYTGAWPLLNGEVETGVTLHRMDPGIDTGPILHQVVLPISIDDTARDVYHGCLRLGYEVLRDHIPGLVDHPRPGRRQAVAESTYYGPDTLDFHNLQINLRQTAFQVHNAVRAFTFQEYQLPSVLERRVRGSRLTERTSTAKPGSLVSETNESFFISTIDYDLELLKDFSFALFDAVDVGDAAATTELAPHLPTLEVRNQIGLTPLMVAARTGSMSVVAALLSAGADPSASMKDGTTVLDHASQATNSAAVDRIEQWLAQGS